MMKHSYLAAFAFLLFAGTASAQVDAYSSYPANPYAMATGAHSPYVHGGQPPVHPEMAVGSSVMQGESPYGPTFGCCSDPQCGGSGACGSGHESLRFGYYASVDAIFLKRSTAEGGALVVDSITGDTLADVQDLSFNFEPGYKVTYGIFSEAGPGLETVYYNISDWHSSEFLQRENQLSLPGDIGLATFDFFGADRMRIDYDSYLHNAEVNYLMPYGHVTVLTGFRYLQFTEELNINAQDSDTGRSDYFVEADNRLWGAQIGFRAEYEFYRVGLEIFAKAGIFDNAGYQRNHLRDFDNTITLRSRDTKGAHFASVGELGISGTVKLSEVWTLRAGYNLISIGGLALAPQQLDFNDTIDAGTRLNMDGELLAHGMNIGFEGRW